MYMWRIHARFAVKYVLHYTINWISISIHYFLCICGAFKHCTIWKRTQDTLSLHEIHSFIDCTFNRQDNMYVYTHTPRSSQASKRAHLHTAHTNTMGTNATANTHSNFIVWDLKISYCKSNPFSWVFEFCQRGSRK